MATGKTRHKVRMREKIGGREGMGKIVAKAERSRKKRKEERGEKRKEKTKSEIVELHDAFKW